MNEIGSGGLGAVSIGIPEAFVVVILLAAVLFGAWKLAKILWAALSG